MSRKSITVLVISVDSSEGDDASDDEDGSSDEDMDIDETNGRYFTSRVCRVL